MLQRQNDCVDAYNGQWLNGKISKLTPSVKSKDIILSGWQYVSIENSSAHHYWCLNKKNYKLNNHVLMGGFKSIRKQMYKLYIE